VVDLSGLFWVTTAAKSVALILGSFIVYLRFRLPGDVRRLGKTNTDGFLKHLSWRYVLIGRNAGPTLPRSTIKIQLEERIFPDGLFLF